MNLGFAQLRRGLVDHLLDGRLTSSEHSAYCLMIQLADHKTGIWKGSAKHLASLYGAGDVDERRARYLLESLEKKGYIKRFVKRRQRGNYSVLIDKFNCSDGAYKGRRLNAALTTDWRTSVYDPLPSDCQPTVVPFAPKQEEEVKAAVAATTTSLDVWKVLGLKIPIGPLHFQKLWEHYFTARIGELLSEAMERCIQAAQRRGACPAFS